LLDDLKLNEAEQFSVKHDIDINRVEQGIKAKQLL